MRTAVVDRKQRLPGFSSGGSADGFGF